MYIVTQELIGNYQSVVSPSNVPHENIIEAQALCAMCQKADREHTYHIWECVY